MRLNEIAINILKVVFILAVLVVSPRHVFSDEPISTPTMTDEEAEKYFHEKYDNFKSGHAQAGEEERENVKNHKVETHPFHYKYISEQKPDPPSNFKIEPGNGKAQLTWDIMPRALGYVVLISTDGVKYKRGIHKPILNNKANIPLK